MPEGGRKMKNSTFGGLLVLVSFMVTFCFFQGDCSASGLKLDKEAKALAVYRCD